MLKRSDNKLMCPIARVLCDFIPGCNRYWRGFNSDRITATVRTVSRDAFFTDSCIFFHRQRTQDVLEWRFMQAPTCRRRPRCRQTSGSPGKEKGSEGDSVMKVSKQRAPLRVARDDGASTAVTLLADHQGSDRCTMM